ncbi:hypothetical protein [Streptomyces sp. NRRL S-118]|uniref:hypothetical protein n=1 Tax=Streptomyces sp. NRRL S-118 TaxID=1463881 RepID=UPI0004CACC78|nr:hypothetical protein [Streptomyces sp. NRRL S-118]
MLETTPDRDTPTRGRQEPGGASPGLFAAVLHRWPTLLALVVVAATFGDGLPPLERLAWLLAIMPVCYLVFGFARGEFKGRGVLAVQVAGLAGFGALALAALVSDGTLARYVLAAGWLGHAVWDFAHYRSRKVVPRGWSEWCCVVDLLGAVALVVLAH